MTKFLADYDKDRREAGETWNYLGYDFLPYNDGLSLFLYLDGQREWHIRKQWTAEEQTSVIQDFGECVVEVSARSLALHSAAPLAAIIQQLSADFTIAERLHFTLIH